MDLFEQALKRGAADRSDFDGICREIGADRRKLDLCLRDSTGFCGEDIIKSYKFDLPYLFL